MTDDREAEREVIVQQLLRLCQGHEDEWMTEIRIHPQDRDALRPRVMVGYNFDGLPIMGEPGPLAAYMHPTIPMRVRGDATMVDGPQIEWRPRT